MSLYYATRQVTYTSSNSIAHCVPQYSFLYLLYFKDLQLLSRRITQFSGHDGTISFKASAFVRQLQQVYW